VTVLVASDLDRTLIYSSRALLMTRDESPLACVEVHDGQDASFMTAAAAHALVELSARTVFVPVTSRMPEQFERVTLPGAPPRFAIAANGGVLYVDGAPDRAWSAGVARSLAAEFPLADVWAHAAQICRPEWTIKLRNVAGMFCYALVRPHRLPPGFVADVAGWAAERGWRISLQGRKLYWVPETLTKSAAVAEAARRADADVVLAAGDSLLDTDLLLHSDLGIHPRHGELFETGWSAPNVVATDAAGVRAGEQIVRWFAETAAGVSADGVGAGPTEPAAPRQARGPAA
jgi:hypothetical protein